MGVLLISVGVSVYLLYVVHSIRATMIEERVAAYLAYQSNTIRAGMDEGTDLKIPEFKVIDSIPTEITSPGAYCLSADFETSETAIVIKASNVLIDMAGHRIQGPGTPESSAVGIKWNSKSNIGIRNGTIAGFFYGICGNAPHSKISAGPESAASDITIQNLVLLDNSFRGIRVDAARATIRSNLIKSTGGTTVYDDAYSMGIEVIGPDCLVQGNWIMDTYPVGVGEGVAVSLSHNIDGGRVFGNWISNEQLPFPGRAFAFWIGKGRDIQVTNNMARGFTYPFAPSSTDQIFARNIFSRMECSIDDYPDRYRKYQYTASNHFIFEVDGCTADDASTFLPLAESGDPLAMFRLGIIATDPCEVKYWWQRAASLGHKESMRLLKKRGDYFEQRGCNNTYHYT